MKKLIIFGLFFLSMLNLSAQNIDDMMEMITAGKLKEAKIAVDKYLSNPKKQNDPDGWYVKGKVYNALSKESTNTFVQNFSMKMEAFEAFQKNQSLDKKDVRMKLEEYIPYFDIYAELYNAGIKNYNDKDFEGAFNAFKKTNEVKDFILSKGYKNEQIPLVLFDTVIILNIAICAEKANREADMYEFYKKIINASIGGDEYKDIYRQTIEYHIKKNEYDSALSILEKAQKVFPNEDLWFLIEVKFAEQRDGRSGMLAKYEELIKLHPTNFLLNFNYSAELFNSLYDKNATNIGDSLTEFKLTNSLIKTIDIEDKNEISALLLLIKHLHRLSYNILESIDNIKGNKPDQLKKKSQLKTISFKKMDECLTFCDKAITFFEKKTDLKESDKLNYMIVLDIVQQLYTSKKDIKAEYYKNKYKSINKD